MIESPDRTPLPRDFFDRPVLEVAPDLLGRTPVRRSAGGAIGLRLNEEDASAGEIDPGSHAFRGRTARKGAMFGRKGVMLGPPGHAYVYLTHGVSRRSA